MKGDLILICDNSLIGKSIRNLTHSEWNHVAMLIDDGFIIESTFKNGVTISTYEKLVELKEQGKRNFVIYRIKDISEEQTNIMINFIADKIGQKYDFFQFIFLSLMLVFGMTRRIEPIDSPNKWLCSELIAEGAYQAGIRFHETIDPDNITPGDIASSKYAIKVDNI